MDIEPPFTMVVSGQSGSGKTMFISKLLQTFNLPITYAYTVHQDLYDRMKSDLPNISFLEGCPSTEEIKPDSIVVLDDMMLECGKEVAVLFTRMRHRNVSTIFVVQNLFFNNRFMRTITLNAHYLVLFQTPRDAGVIKTLGRQMYPEKPKYIPFAFDDATSRPYGYLVINLKPNAQFRVLTGVLPGEEHFAYLPQR
jgi:hypothetical protein